MHTSYTSSVNHVASFRLAWVATFPSRGRLFYAILPTIECRKQFLSVGVGALDNPNIIKKFSPNYISTHNETDVFVGTGVLDGPLNKI